MAIAVCLDVFLSPNPRVSVCLEFTGVDSFLIRFNVVAMIDVYGYLVFEALEVFFGDLIDNTFLK